jgi:lipid A 3-O-deacylase PagL
MSSQRVAHRAQEESRISVLQRKSDPKRCQTWRTPGARRAIVRVLSAVLYRGWSAGTLAIVLASLSAQAAAQPVRQATSPTVPEGGETREISTDAPALELTGLYLVETWDLNGTPRDRLAGGSIAVSLPIHESWQASIELLGAQVVRQTPPDAALVGLLGLVRKRLTNGQHWSFVVEGGLGASYASVEVPDRGTRFNYLLEAGAGVTRPVGRRTSLLLKIRLLHLSNNSLNGPNHNPDIQGLGAQAGMAMRF